MRAALARAYAAVGDRLRHDKHFVATLVTIARQIGTSLLQLAVVIAIARVLGPARQGTFAIATAFQQISTLIFDFGIAAAVIYFVAKGRFDLRQLVHRLALLLAAITVILVLGAALLSVFHLRIFAGIDTITFVLSALTAVAGIASGWALSLPLSRQDYGTYNTAILAQSIAYTVAVLAFATVRLLTVDTAIISVMLSFLVSFWLGFRRRGDLTSNVNDPEPMFGLFKYGLKNMSADLVTILNYRISYFISNSRMGNIQTGVFTLAVSLMEKLWIVSQAVALVALPRMAAEHSAGTRSEHIGFRLPLFTIALSGGLGLGLLLVIWLGSALAFGKLYGSIPLIALCLLPGIVAWSGVRVIAVQFAAFGRPEVNLIVTCMCLLANMLQLILTGSSITIAGLAVITSVSYVASLAVICLFAMWFNRRKKS